MGRKTRVITLSALFSAFTVIMLYIAAIWPTGQAGIVAAASLFTVAAVIETGLLSGIYVYIVSSGLGLLLFPGRASVLLYVLFFGFYPIVKSLIERHGGRVLHWVFKLLVFNAALSVIWIFLRELVFNFGDIPGAPLVFIGGSIVFLLFDYGLTKLIWLYIYRISIVIKKRK